ncbi:MAG: type II toxin-antitoxin system VapC family toxin [Gammaproteobacteria bacterium]|nr:type II toxin-antitoxin system VapC family toxin [Gammaproteobacteria bacterium]MYD77124.1 type II toxin-antitoxin system VapC family toxin [Gammaproteobacteria bacterium]MYJ52710.1 type II toxin-antitoxin system VapC family toxin [Gammaproteobacteria bacterium]
MILVDTSIWIDHLRHGNETLKSLLMQYRVCMHPMIIGELACGNLRNRGQLLELWNNLPKVAVASHEEAIIFLSLSNLAGRGIGYIDVHLLASAKLQPGARLWTGDKRLAEVADSLNLLFVLK